MQDTGQERTEEATPRKRQQARKKGTVTRSQDLVNALVVATTLIVLPGVLSKLFSTLVTGFQGGMANVPKDVSMSSVSGFVQQVGTGPFLAMGVLLGSIMAVGVAANLGQVGFVLSAERLNPSLAKINPLQGLKRLFSFTATFDGIKAFVKSFLFIYLAYGAVAADWDRLVGTAWVDSSGALSVVGDIMRTLALRIAIAWLVLAVGDYLFQRKQVEKQLKMTKAEVKQEFRETEQSPELRAAMARRRRVLAKGRMRDAVKGADVIVTNPTHFAVALQYQPGQMHAPVVVYKGQDLMALRMREVAKEAKIPIVPNPPLARQLYKKCEIGDAVPRDMFQAVAEVLAFVYRTLGEGK